MDTGNIGKSSAQDIPARQRLGAWRFVETNRRIFDSALSAPDAVATRLNDIKDSREEVTKLRAELNAIRSSTAWRLTSPLRLLIESWRRRRLGLAPGELLPEPVKNVAPPMRYEEWLASEEPRYLASLRRPLPGQHKVMPQRLALVYLATPDCAPALAALLADCPPSCQILVLHSGPAPLADGRLRNEEISLAHGPAALLAIALAKLDVDLLCFHDGRDRLAPGALALMAEAAARQPHLDLIFADEDWLSATGGREKPFFKPGWDAEMQRGRDLAGPFTFMRVSLLRAMLPPSGAAWRYDLVNQLAAATQPGRIQHIPAVLCHRAAAAQPPAAALRQAAVENFTREGILASVAAMPETPEIWRVIYELPAAEPLVSVIICTRDHEDLLAACTEGLLNQTDYARLEILIVDNGTVEPAALALLERLAAMPDVRVLRQPGPFNWSALNNLAAAQANGDVILLLNNDISMLRPDWLRVMVSHVIQPGVGAVGAKLLYPDGRVQHAGLTTGTGGIPRHLFRFADATDAGAYGLMAQAREVWGLTGACLAITRKTYRDVGGLNEAFTIGCNDIDLCLRLSAFGYRLIWTPWALAAHHEQATRPPDHIAANLGRAREEFDRLIRDWGNLTLNDPYLNPNLQLQNEQLVLRRFAQA